MDFIVKNTLKKVFPQKSDSGFISPDAIAGDYLNKIEVPVDGNTTYPY
jgi:hypothetical protein